MANNGKVKIVRIMEPVTTQMSRIGMLINTPIIE